MRYNTLHKRLPVFLIITCLIGVNIVSTIRVTAENKPSQLNNCFHDDASFDRLMETLIKIGHMPSLSACIIKNDNVVWTKSYGLYNIDQEKQATENTLYMIASISKTITATALMQLYEQGLFDLDDDVNNYLPFSLRNPRYPNESITFRMLLSHRSSLAEDPPEFYQYFPGDCPIPLYPWLETYLVPGGNNYTSKAWSDDRPGDAFHYANVGFAIVGYLVERLSGVPFDRYCKEHIFDPLDMFNTSFRLSDVDIENLAVPYRFSLRGYTPYEHFGYIEYPAGSVRTSVSEFSHFVVAHMHGGEYNGVHILKNETVEIMHTSHYPGNRYGLGWMIWSTSNGEKFIGHTGGDLGVATSLTIRLSDNVAVIYFTNTHPFRPLELLAWCLIKNLLFWKADNITESFHHKTCSLPLNP
ncbi:MAG TPA: class A beta-lactamase-related serine hydrolase [Thermoplasmatales archaeon]|nr:class A beta-lactamase-related serine hydrolase [Thermoplasmatales archaeon]